MVIYKCGMATKQTTVVYAVAASLDGYIAAEDGGVDWLHASMVKGESYDLDTFNDSIDGVLMGSRTYEKSLAMGGFFGPSKPCWVFSRRALKAGKGVNVTAADPPRLFAFRLPHDRLDVLVELEATAADRTLATITVEGPWLIAFRRTLARRAVNRLYALCQTAASL